MPVVRGCLLPDALLYDVENQLWYRPLADGLVEVGMTAVALAMAADLVAITPRRPGRRIEAGQACAVVETGKLVAAARIACSGFVERSNGALLAAPELASDDPYGAGWLIALRPDDWPAAAAKLVPGTAVAEPYEAKMRRERFAGCAAPGVAPSE
jgi:glycine cleavage system H protein